MADSTYNITDAVQPSGIVDYYTLLGLAPDTSTDALRTRINDLYSEAQANRDHRNLNKRRDYQTLLELLPGARTALLDDEKRARYNQYLAGATTGAAPQSFDDFMAELSGARLADEDRTDVLGVQEAAAAAQTASTTTAKSRKAKAASRARASLIASAASVVVFFLVMLLAHFVVGWDIPRSVLAGAVVAVIVWIVTHLPGNKVST